MKNKLLLMLLLLTTIAYAQIPSYYNDVNLNQNGTALKDELAIKIIGTHTNFLSYTPGVWTTLQAADLDPNNSNNVLLIYGHNDNDGNNQTDRTRGKFDNGGGLGLWNREHVYPRSLGNPNLGSSGPGSDAHHLRACDGQMNSSRNNRKFADGSGNSGITPQGHFYPGDEWKGDVARMMLFMYLRYNDRCLPSNVGVGNTVAGDANMIDLFLQWNAEDPVNAFEDNRNDVIAGIQGNRNPFIDNPAFATQIWGGVQAENRFGSGTSDTQAPTVPANLVASNTTASATQLTWSAATDNIGVTGYDVYQNDTFVTTVNSTVYNVAGLAVETNYTFKVNARDAAGNTSAFSTNTLVVTLPGGGGSGTASDLFISEYIEGSSNNKALEIANFTGATVDLSSYALKKATNGSGSFSSNLSLTGQLANGEVYVVANGSANTTILNQADITNGGVMSFNGNDAIALYKNNALIDLMGNPNSSANYAKDMTLRRKSTVTMPNTSYTTSEWDSFPQNTFADLGTHTVDGGSGPTPDTIAPSIPANVIASNVTETSANLSWTASTDNIGVAGYDVFQNGTFLASTTTTNYSVSGLVGATTYLFTVSAKDVAGNTSALSNAVSVTTDTPADTTAPSVPTSLISSNVTETSANLSWTASTDNIGVTGYDVYQNGTLLASTTTTNYSVSGLVGATTYLFTVSAKDAAENVSALSSATSVTTDTPVVVDTTAPSVPANVIATNVTETSASLSWTASTDNIGVTGYDVYQNGTFLTSVTNTSYSVSGLTASTTYAFAVNAKDVAGNTSALSNAVSVTTDAIVLTYCNSRGNNVNYEFIDFVGLGGISNSTSANGGYGDFTNFTGNIGYGSNTIVLSIGFPGSSYTENWKVWIDFNQNGTFESSEEVVSGSTSSSGNLSYNFNVPSSALAGNTRMRVSMKWNGTPSACETFTYGEVEDYTVNIGSSAARVAFDATIRIDGQLTQEQNIYDAKVFTASGVLNIQMADDRAVNYTITNVLGQVVANGNFSKAIKLSNIDEGVYILAINDGQRTINKKFIKK